MAFSMLIAPGTSFFTATIYMWSMIPLKYLLLPKITEEKMKNGERQPAVSHGIAAACGYEGVLCIASTLY